MNLTHFHSVLLIKFCFWFFKVKPCELPEDTPNGYYQITSGEDFVFGTTIKYFCNEGYVHPAILLSPVPSMCPRNHLSDHPMTGTEWKNMAARQAGALQCSDGGNGDFSGTRWWVGLPPGHVCWSHGPIECQFVNVSLEMIAVLTKLDSSRETRCHKLWKTEVFKYMLRSCNKLTH